MFVQFKCIIIEKRLTINKLTLKYKVTFYNFTDKTFSIFVETSDETQFTKRYIKKINVY